MFHVILKRIEPLGIFFRKGQGYGSGFFQKGHDRLYLKIEEALVEKQPEPGKQNRRRNSWQAQEDEKIGSGNLAVSLTTERYSARGAKLWTEGEKAPLGELLAQVVTEIRRHYVEMQQKREQEAIEAQKQRVESEKRWHEYQEKEAIRKSEEQKQKHAATIDSVIRHRKNDLLKAAEWWRLHQVAQDFIAACEGRWRSEQADTLKPEQEEWLCWARKTIMESSPFAEGYPDPGVDGTFSPLEVPFGGPYPATRQFPRPPTMPEIPAPVVVRQGYDSSASVAPPKPYPFWLKHQR